MAQDDSDRIYKLTIRSLYVAALVLNAWVLWDQVKDTTEGQALRQRLSSATDKLTTPWRERKRFRRNANQVIFEATTIVEGTDSDN